ncbi:MAG: hypothetical protein AB7F89_11595 [Pirellulaceae bacterium]
MAAPPPTSAQTPLPPEIRELLARLRRRIRAYVWLEGISLAIIWLVSMFWLGLALDYLPVLAGVGEMPRTARALLLSAVGVVFLWIFYRWILRRYFARLADRSMALLLERRFHELQDGLITSVELTGQAGATPAGQAMLAETERETLRHIRHLPIHHVFNFRPLTVSTTAAIVLMATIGGLYVINAHAFELGIRRLYLLDDALWPRRARIEVVGVQRRDAATGATTAEPIPFQAGQLKTAKGSSLGLLVRADAGQPTVPEVCTIQYRTREGERGRVHMTRVGRVRDGFQSYKYDGKPFDGVLSDIEFDVIGGDHRVSGYSIRVVDSPTLVDVQVSCQFPPYLVDEQLSTWLPRTVAYTAGLQLPQGTRLRLHCRANKPLRDVTLLDPDSQQTVSLPLDAGRGDALEFEYEVPALGEHFTMDVALTDTDNVQSERPYRIHLGGVSDVAPTVNMRLAGIGTAVTPDVLLPLRGTITDDYGLARTWVEIAANDGAPREFSFQPTTDGAAEVSVDFRSERAKPEGMVVQVQDKLVVTVKASDKRALDGGPNLAVGDQYTLEVVSPDQLLALLEGRELGLRRRFEQIVEEVNQTRDMLLRVRNDGPEVARAAASADTGEPTSESGEGADSATERLERAWSMRVLRTRQSLMQSEKAALEVLGVAAGFRDIRAELTNNRVDTEDRKERLEQQIAVPLERIGQELFPELDRRLGKLTQVLAGVEQRRAFQQEDAETLSAADASIEQITLVLSKMDEVLKQMVDLQDFNELLDIVRSLIDEQRQLLNDVKQEQKQSLRDLLK